jgi:hypothetical protein
MGLRASLVFPLSFPQLRDFHAFSVKIMLFGKTKTLARLQAILSLRPRPRETRHFWTAPAERSDDGALDEDGRWEMGDRRWEMADWGAPPSSISHLPSSIFHLPSSRAAIQSGVALRFPPQSITRTGPRTALVPQPRRLDMLRLPRFPFGRNEFFQAGAQFLQVKRLGEERKIRRSIAHETSAPGYQEKSCLILSLPP